MLYTKFGSTGTNLSKLGFGAMRLPMQAADPKKVDYDLSTPLLRRCVELGVNYIDTAPYYCEGDSETAVGKAIKGIRDKVYISTKNPIEDASYDNWMTRLELSLKKLDTDYIDFYHMWAISLDTFNNKIDIENGPIKAAIKAKEQGLIKYLCFSYHDEKPENMKPIIDSGYFESVLMQYNLLDRSNEENIAYAKEKGLGVIIMGPVGGGRLGSPSEKIKNMLNRPIHSTAEMALRFVLAQDGVNMALSGMENIDMLEENVKVASIEGTLTSAETAVVIEMMEENKKLSDLYCTGCKYCLPCPMNINIPHLFGLMNNHKVYNLTDHAKSEYALTQTSIEERAEVDKDKGFAGSFCIECGACEARCPQHIKIIEQLKETHNSLNS